MVEASGSSRALELADMLEGMVLDFRDVLAEELGSTREKFRENRASAEERIKAINGRLVATHKIE